MHIHDVCRRSENNNHRLSSLIYFLVKRAKLCVLMSSLMMTRLCVSKAYAKFVLCLSLTLSLTSSWEVFETRFLSERSENHISKAYARHMMYIQKMRNDKNERKWEENWNSICHKISIFQAYSEQNFILRLQSKEMIVAEDWLLINICLKNALLDSKNFKNSKLLNWTLIFVEIMFRN